MNAFIRLHLKWHRSAHRFLKMFPWRERALFKLQTFLRCFIRCLNPCGNHDSHRPTNFSLNSNTGHSLQFHFFSHHRLFALCMCIVHTAHELQSVHCTIKSQLDRWTRELLCFFLPGNYLLSLWEVVISVVFYVAHIFCSPSHDQFIVFFWFDFISFSSISSNLNSFLFAHSLFCTTKIHVIANSLLALLSFCSIFENILQGKVEKNPHNNINNEKNLPFKVVDLMLWSAHFLHFAHVYQTIKSKWETKRFNLEYEKKIDKEYCFDDMIASRAAAAAAAFQVSLCHGMTICAAPDSCHGRCNTLPSEKSTNDAQYRKRKRILMLNDSENICFFIFSCQLRLMLFNLKMDQKNVMTSFLSSFYEKKKISFARWHFNVHDTISSL